MSNLDSARDKDSLGPFAGEAGPAEPESSAVSETGANGASVAVAAAVVCPSTTAEGVLCLNLGAAGVGTTGRPS